MSVTTISTPVTVGVTLRGNYSAGISITNTGSIIADPESGIGIYSGITGSLYVGNSGYVSGLDAIFARHQTDVVNSGVLTGTNLGVFLLQAGSSLTNQKGGTINGGRWGVVGDSGLNGINSGIISGGTGAYGTGAGLYLLQGGSILNDGTISSIYGPAIENLTGAFTLAVGAGAVFDGAVDDLAGGGVLSLTGDTAGTLDMGTSFTGFSSIAFGTSPWSLEGDTAELASGEAISGFTAGDTIILSGVSASAAALVSGVGLVLSSGATQETIALTSALPAGDQIEVAASGNTTSVTVEQSPVSIISTGITSSVYLANGTYAAGISITNTGSIKVNPETGYGIYGGSTGSFYVRNSGYVSGKFAIVSFNQADIVNTGVITGTGIGVALGQPGSSLTNQTGGTINGGRWGVDAANRLVGINSGLITGALGIYLGAGGSILNAGTITGTSGAAIENANEDFTLAVGAGAVFHGAVDDLAGGGVLSLTGDTAGTLDMGTSFTGFSSIAFGTSPWSLEGDTAELANGEAISGFTEGDTIILSGVSASAAALVSGVGLVLTSGATQETIALTSALPAGDQIEVTASGNTTSLTVKPPVSIISTGITSSVYLGTGTYAADLTITNAGAITPASGIAAYVRGISNFRLTNQGRIIGVDAGLYSFADGTVDNSGLIQGRSDVGIQIDASANDFVENSGTITGFYGIATQSGRLTASNTGLISGRVGPGIYLGSGGYLFNSGTIKGGPIARNYGYESVYNFSGAFTLAVGAGAAFDGAVRDNAGGGVLSLAGATAGSLDMGSSFTGFSNISFGSTPWTLSGAISDLANGQTITGFAPGDTIDLHGVLAASSSFSNDTLTLFNANGASLTSLHIIDPNTTAFTVKPDGANGTLLAAAACYAAGTRIRTPYGEKSIEALQIGDMVLDPAGNARPIIWLGHRTIDCAGHPNPQDVWPVLIRQSAFAEGVPARDLFVSPGHSVYAEGRLMQAEKLVNGATIIQLQIPRITYWHVELEQHGLVFAEGLLAETYLDTGNRCAFINGGPYTEAHPDFRPKHWAQTCVPLVFDGPEMAGAKIALLARARELGHQITHEDDLHIIADGQRFDPIRLTNTRAAFLLPAGCEAITLRSRTFKPAQINPKSADGRTLGTRVKRLQLDGQDVAIDDDNAFGPGWHHHEPCENSPGARWTTGVTPIPSSTRLVMIDFAGPGYYWTRNETVEIEGPKHMTIARG